ncbi:MAG: hypothetical protein B5766_07745 [Candidatus Lumbricidophila eiseniae]|uniref:Uncharacterized protein n=1 Tax=Candidatus Lumbricidiphila eiseniae TaxID=1969409 RepID=A0A2A6FRG9_9MICO|nr:MAG: hypothetical protein B5766_07745 [Candidatus Lumbricidophila eiseniae]
MNVTTASDQPDPPGRVGLRARYRALSRRARISLAITTTVTVVAGGISGGAATVAGVRHQNALNRYTLHTTQLQDAISADHTVSDQLTNAYATAQDIQKLTPLTDQLAGLVEQTPLDTFKTALTAQKTETDAAAQTTHTDLTQTPISVARTSVSPDATPTEKLSTDQLNAHAAEALTNTHTVTEGVTAKQAALDKLTHTTNTTIQAVQGLPTAGITTIVATLVADHPSAGQGEKDTVTAAATALTADTPAAPTATGVTPVVAVEPAYKKISDLLTQYLDAVTKLKTSHAEVEAQKAAEAAAQAAAQAAREAAQKNNRKPTNGAGRSNGRNTGSGGSNSGGGNSGDGSNTGGGGSSGGGGNTGGGNKGNGGASQAPADDGQIPTPKRGPACSRGTHGHSTGMVPEGSTWKYLGNRRYSWVCGNGDGW